MPGEATPSSSTQNVSPPRAVAVRADANRAVRRRELVGVREQVDEHLRQALLVAAHDGHAVGDLDLDALPSLRDQRLDELARRDDDVVENHVLMPNRELARLDAHALEQVVDEPREPLRAALQRGHELALALDAHRADAVAQQLDRRELRRERRAELVRDVREHRVARAARRFELGLVAQDLHLHAVGRRRRARDDDAARTVGARRDVLERAARAAAARFDDRAGVLARPAAVGVERRLQHVAAESAHRLLRRDLQQPLCLRIQEADPPLLVDGIDAFDDSAEHGLRLELAAAQVGRQLDEVAPHSLHRGAEQRELLAAADGNRRGEVSGAEPLGGVGQALDGADPVVADEDARRERERGDQRRDEQDVARHVAAGAMTSSTGRRASSKAIVSPLVEAMGKLAAYEPIAST